MREEVEICARCDRLDVKSHPEQLKQGSGYCMGHGDGSPSRGPLEAWDSRACVLFMPARPMAPRERWIEKHQAKQQQQAQPERMT